MEMFEGETMAYSYHKEQWARSRDGLISALAGLGYPAEFGQLIARQLGSPKAIDRMTAYLGSARPRTMEEIADEMLAIQSEIETWREKKASEEANARYNDILNYGLYDGQDT